LGFWRIALKEKINKYGAKKTVIAGITFDSRAEALRYQALVLLQKAGRISGLTLQVPFVLAQSVRFAAAKRAKPALRYVADFVYCEAGVIVVEDVKGVQTDAFKIKQHLMMSVHGVDVRITK
jgi:hypothetical protein